MSLTERGEKILKCFCLTLYFLLVLFIPFGDIDWRCFRGLFIAFHPLFFINNIVVVAAAVAVVVVVVLILLLLLLLTVGFEVGDQLLLLLEHDLQQCIT